jgi:hypothetical protein
MSHTQRWKYLVVTIKAGWTGRVSDERLQDELNSHGSLGWQLVTIVSAQSGWSLKLVFKRES